MGASRLRQQEDQRREQVAHAAGLEEQLARHVGELRQAPEVERKAGGVREHAGEDEPERARRHLGDDRLDRHDAARSAVSESLRLDPENEECFALLSAIELSHGDWSAALVAAEQALALNPENVEATNFRAMALVRLGRKDEATQAVDFALHRAPENALSHANQGWNYLHRNEPRRAQEFFREALRLEPGMEYARQGMLEALRARTRVRSFLLSLALSLSLR